MVLDTDCDPFTATMTSLRAAMANKIIMLMWVPLVGILVLIGLITPYFIGLVVVIPVLAHATWHAYKAMIGKLE